MWNGLVIVAAWLLATAAQGEAWRAAEALGAPEVLSLEADHRTRYEFIDDQFRLASSGERDSWLLFRTRVRARLAFAEWLSVGAEFQDARVAAESQSSPLGTGVVNAAELLRAYVEVRSAMPFGGTQTTQLGRITMDVGSRRLVARSRFRNTASAFTGLDWRWELEGGGDLRAFYTLPVMRKPTRRAELADNEIEFDEEDFDFRFWGLYYEDEVPCGCGDRFDLYFFGLRAGDGVDLDLYTPGFRLRRPRAAGAFDYELENVLQFGEVDILGGDRDHFAHFHHVELGYSFDAPCSPRIAVQYDYASGDDDSLDDESNRFNTLFGARRFDFGPTSLYGAFARANINTPGLLFQVEPFAGMSAFAKVRAFWLAESSDRWTTAGIPAALGSDVDEYVGTQLELRIRYDLLPGNARLEAGYAHLFASDFAEDVGAALDDVDYFYTQLVLSF